MPDDITPMMRQYRQIRSGLPSDTILFFRLGDFYEMFYQDALNASRILDIALTRRHKVPMCGVPYHSAENYISRLVKAGKKVAVCDQVEPAAAGRGIVRREITSVLSPGAVTIENLLDSKRPNYLAGLCSANGVYGLALLELSTGEFIGEEPPSAEALKDSLLRIRPGECVLPAAGEAGEEDPFAFLAEIPGLPVSRHEDWAFEREMAYETLKTHFGVHSLAGFGIEGKSALICAAGGVMHYVKNNLRRNPSHVRSIKAAEPSGFLVMDEATRVNLELVHPKNAAYAPADAAGRRAAPTLLGVLDTTRTPMGARMLRERILRPSADLKTVRERHDAVEALAGDRTLLGELRETLSNIRDMERITARLGTGGGNARDIRALGQSLKILPEIAAGLKRCRDATLKTAANRIEPLPDLLEIIEKAISDEPPAAINEGGMIKPGYNAQLDELHSIARAGRNWLAEYQTGEQQRTGIKTLKVRHNKVFGYYIEISKGQADRAPAEYARKQTLVNAERFITPELKEYENKILGARDRAIALEQEIFQEIRDACLARADSIQKSSAGVAEADVLACLAERSLVLGYTRPKMTGGTRITIKDGRHPVVEQMPGAERFVPNDTLLDNAANLLALITGPNMAGKSTYIRQVALIVIMAHAGCFVPASEAEIALVDRVFTRVGAGDDIAGGRSTFMVEMQETANILNNATNRSLVVLDEIGRGTSTFDGISIAWAVAEHLHNTVKAKTLFATHYHELTDLALTLRGVKNYNVLVREQNERIAFLRRIVPGGSDKSYGIHVGKLAGLPDEVIARAREILMNLEEGELGESGTPKLARRRPRREADNAQQATLFPL